MSSHSQTLPGKAWLTIICGMIINLNLGCLYAFSVWRATLFNQKFLTNAALTNIYLLSCFLFGLLMIFGGWLTDRIGPRITAMIGGAVMGVGLLITGLVIKGSPFWAMLVGFGFLSSMGMGLAFAATVPAALKWCGRRWAGMVAGWVVFTYALQAVYLVPLVRFLVDNISLGGSFIILGLSYGVFITIAALGLLTPPPGYAAPGPWAGGTTRAPSLVQDAGVGEALASPQFYFMFFLFMIGTIVGLTFISKAVGVLDMAPSNIRQTFFILVGVFGLINALSRPITGLISDLSGRYWPMLILYGGAALGALLLIVSLKGGIFWLIIPVLACSHFFYGSLFSLFPAMTVDFYGTRNLGTIYGFIFFGGFGLGSVVIYFIGRLAAMVAGTDLHSQYTFISFVLGLFALLGVGLTILPRLCSSLGRYG